MTVRLQEEIIGRDEQRHPNMVSNNHLVQKLVLMFSITWNLISSSSAKLLVVIYQIPNRLAKFPRTNDLNFRINCSKDN